MIDQKEGFLAPFGVFPSLETSIPLLCVLFFFLLTYILVEKRERENFVHAAPREWKKARGWGNGGWFLRLVVVVNGVVWRTEILMACPPFCVGGGGGGFGGGGGVGGGRAGGGGGGSLLGAGIGSARAREREREREREMGKNPWQLVCRSEHARYYLSTLRMMLGGRNGHHSRLPRAKYTPMAGRIVNPSRRIAIVKWPIPGLLLFSLDPIRAARPVAWNVNTSSCIGRLERKNDDAQCPYIAVSTS